MEPTYSIGQPAWEVNCLDAENQRLRASDEEADLRVNLIGELEQTNQDTKVSTSELETCKRRLKEVEQRCHRCRVASVGESSPGKGGNRLAEDYD